MAQIGAGRWLVAALLAAAILLRADAQPQFEANVCKGLGYGMMNFVLFGQCKTAISNALYKYTESEITQLIDKLQVTVLQSPKNSAEIDPNVKMYTFTLVGAFATNRWQYDAINKLIDNLEAMYYGEESMDNTTQQCRFNYVMKILSYKMFYWWEKRLDERSLRVFNFYPYIGQMARLENSAEYIDRYIDWAYDKTTRCDPALVLTWISTLLTSKAIESSTTKQQDENDFYDILCDKTYEWNAQQMFAYRKQDKTFTLVKAELLILLQQKRNTERFDEKQNVDIYVSIDDRDTLWSNQVQTATLLQRLKNNFSLAVGYKTRLSLVKAILGFGDPDWWLKVTSDNYIRLFDVWPVVQELVVQEDYIYYIEHFYRWAKGKADICTSQTVFPMFKYFYAHTKLPENRKAYRRITFEDRDVIYDLVCNPKFGWTNNPQNNDLEKLFLPNPATSTLKVEVLIALLRHRFELSHQDLATALEVIKKLDENGWAEETIVRYIAAFNQEHKFYVESQPSNDDRQKFMLDHVKDTIEFNKAEWWKGLFTPYVTDSFKIFKIFTIIKKNKGFIPYIDAYKAYLDKGQPKYRTCDTETALKAFMFSMKLTKLQGGSNLSGAELKAVTEVYEAVCDQSHGWTAEDIGKLVNEADFNMERSQLIEILTRAKLRSSRANE